MRDKGKPLLTVIPSSHWNSEEVCDEKFTTMESGFLRVRLCIVRIGSCSATNFTRFVFWFSRPKPQIIENHIVAWDTIDADHVWDIAHQSSFRLFQLYICRPTMMEATPAADVSSSETLPPFPQRSLNSTSRLSKDSVSIVGLGCSSFSTFFWSQQDWEAAADNGETNDHKRSDKSTETGKPTNQFTVDTLQEDHPIVRSWIDTIHYALLEAGITLLDTAPWYGHGTSEVVIGWALKKLLAKKPRNQFFVNTKVGRSESDPRRQFDFSKGAVLESVQRSVQRLQCEYIDVLQLHDPEFAPTLDILFQEAIPALLECRDKYKYCKALGMTGYPLTVQHQLLERSMEVYKTNIWDQALTYGHYTLHDTSLWQRTFVKDLESPKWTSYGDYCQSQGIRVLSAAPLSMGLLTPQGPPAWHPASSELQNACHQAVQLCRDQGVDVTRLATIFALSEPRIACTILGMKGISEIQAAQRAAAKIPTDQSTFDARTIQKEALSEAEFSLLERIMDPLQGPFASVWGDKGFEEWDGIAAVREFYMQLPDIATQPWQQA